MVNAGARIPRPGQEESTPVFKGDWIRLGLNCVQSHCTTQKFPMLQDRKEPCGGQGLTGNIVIVVLLELQAHVVGAELLELDGETDFLLWPIAGDQHIGVEHGAAGSCLLRPHQVQLVVFIGPPSFCSGADDVQLVSNLWVDHQALPTQEPAQEGRDG